MHRDVTPAGHFQHQCHQSKSTMYISLAAGPLLEATACPQHSMVPLACRVQRPRCAHLSLVQADLWRQWKSRKRPHSVPHAHVHPQARRQDVCPSDGDVVALHTLPLLGQVRWGNPELAGSFQKELFQSHRCCLSAFQQGACSGVFCMQATMWTQAPTASFYCWGPRSASMHRHLHTQLRAHLASNPSALHPSHMCCGMCPPGVERPRSLFQKWLRMALMTALHLGCFLQLASDGDERPQAPAGLSRPPAGSCCL